MVESPIVRVEAWQSPNLEVICPTNVQTSTRNYLLSKVRQLVEEHPGPLVTVELKTNLLEHVGLGSKTSATLAALVAASYASGRRVDDSEIQRLSGRGGASGIGIHGFFTGGFIVDAGRLGRFPLYPSSLQEPDHAPTVIRTTPMPEDWRVTLILPPGVRRSGATESAFFAKVTPIDRLEVLEQLALVYHGMVPAVLEEDLEGFGESLRAFSALGFKAREISAQSPAVSDIMSALREVAPCVGMSSMGPLIFTLTKERILEEPTCLA